MFEILLTRNKCSYIIPVGNKCSYDVREEHKSNKGEYDIVADYFIQGFMNKQPVIKIINKRRFLTVVITLTIAITAVFYVSSVYAYGGSGYETVIVQRGDTLWDIAGKYNKGGDIRKFIFEIKKANNMSNSTIYEGDSIKIPL